MFVALNSTDIFNRIDVRKAKFDEIHVMDDVTIAYDKTRKEWNYRTLMLCQFLGNLEGGNLNLGGQKIERIRIRRRKKEDMIFEDIKVIDYESDKFVYDFQDFTAESLQDYVYGLQPENNSIRGNLVSGEIESNFDSTWLIGANERYQLAYNLQLGDYESVIPSEIVEVLGNQYPYIISNGDVNYRKGNVKCMLLSDSTVNGSSGEQIDRKAEKLQRISIDKFLKNRKPKIYKSGDGTFMLVMINGVPVLTPNNDLQGIYEISINYLEIGDSSIQSLIQNGLIKI